jgi:hypothetical protein
MHALRKIKPGELLWLVEVWKRQPGEYFALASAARDGDKDFRTHFFAKEDITLENLMEHAQKNMIRHQYQCLHGFTRPERKKRYAVPPALLYADIDGAKVPNGKMAPTIVIESSPGRHVGIWVFPEPLPDFTLNQRLTYWIGADKGGWDPTHVLRMPGTYNWKKEYRNKNGEYPVARIAKETKFSAKHPPGMDGFEGTESDLVLFERTLPLLEKQASSPENDGAWQDIPSMSLVEREKVCAPLGRDTRNSILKGKPRDEDDRSRRSGSSQTKCAKPGSVGKTRSRCYGTRSGTSFRIVHSNCGMTS